MNHEKRSPNNHDCLGGDRDFFGLEFLFTPGSFYATLGLQDVPAYVSYFLGLLGFADVLTSVFLILSARDPLKNILWAQICLAWALFEPVIPIYFMIKGNVTFHQVGLVPIMEWLFAVAFLVFYPRRKAPAR